jgi:hypothetical protein
MAFVFSGMTNMDATLRPLGPGVLLPRLLPLLGATPPSVTAAMLRLSVAAFWFAGFVAFLFGQSL